MRVFFVTDIYEQHQVLFLLSVLCDELNVLLSRLFISWPLDYLNKTLTNQ